MKKEKKPRLNIDDALRMAQEPVTGLIGYGEPRDIEEQLDLALASLHVVEGYLRGASCSGIGGDDKDSEAGSRVMYRALEFL